MELAPKGHAIDLDFNGPANIEKRIVSELQRIGYYDPNKYIYRIADASNHLIPINVIKYGIDKAKTFVTKGITLEYNAIDGYVIQKNGDAPSMDNTKIYDELSEMESPGIIILDKNYFIEDDFNKARLGEHIIFRYKEQTSDRNLPARMGKPKFKKYNAMVACRAIINRHFNYVPDNLKNLTIEETIAPERPFMKEFF